MYVSAKKLAKEVRQGKTFGVQNIPVQARFAPLLDYGGVLLRYKEQTAGINYCYLSKCLSKGRLLQCGRGVARDTQHIEVRKDFESRYCVVRWAFKDQISVLGRTWASNKLQESILRYTNIYFVTIESKKPKIGIHSCETRLIGVVKACKNG